MNRRAFVSGAFGGSLLAAAGPASAITTETSLDSVYNIRDYGATGDGLSPDHTPIQKALDAASKQGGIVFFPPGKYLLGATLYIDAPIILQGSGWHRNNPSLGTWFYIKDTESQVAFRSPDAQGAQLRDIAFFYDQPHGAPRDYKYAIHVMRDDVHISNVHLFNATNGILIKNNGAIGRVVLDHIWGRPLRNGIFVDTALDVVKINDVHFWPFWNKDQGWARSNGVGIRLGRVDNPQLSNIFVLGYDVGIETVQAEKGITSKLMMMNVDADMCNRALVIGGQNTTAVVTNFSAQGSPGVHGINIVGDGARLQAANIRLTNYTANALKADGNASRVFLQNAWLELWNRSDSGFSAIEASSGATVYLGRPVFFDRGNGAPRTEGNVLSEWDDLIAEQ